MLKYHITLNELKQQTSIPQLKDLLAKHTLD